MKLDPSGHLPLVDHVPLWLLFVVTVLLSLAVLALGYFIGRRMRSADKQESQTPIRNIVSAQVGLLTLLLAFTFGMAANHYSARKEATLDEANSIKEDWLRSMILPPEPRQRAQALLREFLEARADLITMGVPGTSPRAATARRNIFYLGVELRKTYPNSKEVQLFVDSIDEYPGLRGRVIAGSRIPITIWYTVYILSILAMIPLGYHAGIVGSLRLPVTLPLLISFAMVLVLIADLDSPLRGQLRSSQSEFDEVRRVMEEEAPAGEPLSPP